MKKLNVLLAVCLFTSVSFAGAVVSGTIIGWGDNTSGQVSGIPHIGNSTNVVTIGGQVLTNIIAIAAGSAHGLALRDDGTVSGWGFDYYGQANGYKASGLYHTNGMVAINGQLLSNVIAITAWENSSLALKNDGTVVSWGESWGQPMEPPIGLSNVVAITKGSLALTKIGTVIGWGHSKTPVGLSNVVAIAASGTPYSQVLALRNDGTLVEWNDWRGEPSVPNGLSNIVAIAVGTRHSGGVHYLALKKDGTVSGWGDNDQGQATGVLGGPEGLITINGQVISNIVAIAAGTGYSLGLKTNGTVVAWGKMWGKSKPESAPDGLSNVVVIAAGNNFCLAITTNSAVADKFLQK